MLTFQFSVLVIIFISIYKYSIDKCILSSILIELAHAVLYLPGRCHAQRIQGYQYESAKNYGVYVVTT